MNGNVRSGGNGGRVIGDPINASEWWVFFFWNGGTEELVLGFGFPLSLVVNLRIDTLWGSRRTRLLPQYIEFVGSVAWFVTEACNEELHTNKGPILCFWALVWIFPEEFRFFFVWLDVPIFVIAFNMLFLFEDILVKFVVIMLLSWFLWRDSGFVWIINNKFFLQDTW